MRFMFRWSFILCLLALGQAFRAALRENWQDKLICECKEVKSVDDCPNYIKKEDGFPPSFPRYYHHKIQTTTKYVNYCCGFTSSDIKKRFWQRKQISQEKGMCLEERRPLPTNNCCNAEHAKGAMGDLGVVLKFGKAYSMAHPLMTSKKHEDLKFEDYEQKSKVFFDRKDIDRVSTPAGDLGKAKVKDVLKDFKKRFAASVKPEIGLLRCKQGFDSLYHGSCRMQPKTRVCCCPEQSLLEAGKKECKEVKGAENKKFIVRKTPVLDDETVEEYEGETWSVWEQDAPVWRTPAKKAPMWLYKIEPESKGKFQWRKSKLQNASIECTEWEEYDGPDGRRSLTKDYCVKHKMTLICDAGKVLYEQVPGIELQYDEFACREGLKNNVISDPDYDERCYCQWERNLMFFPWRLRDSARRKKKRYLGVGPLGWNFKHANTMVFHGIFFHIPSKGYSTSEPQEYNYI